MSCNSISGRLTRWPHAANSRRLALRTVDHRVIIKDAIEERRISLHLGFSKMFFEPLNLMCCLHWPSPVDAPVDQVRAINLIR